MNALRLEELEQRDLLNAAYHVPPPAPRGADVHPTFGIERPAFADLGGGLGRAEFAGLQSSLFSEVSSRSFDGETLIIVQPSEIVVVVVSVQMPAQQDGNPPPSSYDNGGSSTAATPPVATPKPAPHENAPSPTPTPSVADLSSSRTPAAVTAARTTPQTTPFTLVPSTNVLAPSSDTSHPSNVFLLQGLHGVSPFIGAGPASLGPIAPPSGSEVPPAAESVEPPQAQPAPAELPGVLAALSSGDLSALGRGLGQFLNRLEKAGEELVGDGDGLRPWLIAGAAAATACEIARRQLKRAAELAAAAEVVETRPELFVG
jgi:hypothetical protein